MNYLQILAPVSTPVNYTDLAPDPVYNLRKEWSSFQLITPALKQMNNTCRLMYMYVRSLSQGVTLKTVPHLIL